MAGVEDDPGLPIKLHPVSNGEFVPRPASPLVRETVRRARAELARNARRVGMSRRDFLLSAAGSATMLAVLSACSGEQAAERGERPGGSFDVGDESTTTDPEAAADALGGDELIIDVQGHLLEFPPGSDRQPPGFPQANCGADDPRDCFGMDTFLELVLLESDTSAVVLSAVPFPGDLLPPEVMAETIAVAERLCDEPRVLMQGQANPSAAAARGGVGELRAAMAEVAEGFDIGAWKVYTHAGGPGWFLDDHDPSAPQVGGAFLDQAEALGVPVVAVHKGLASGSAARFADPVDIGPAAAAHPNITLVTYHSGYDRDHTEGPFDPDLADDDQRGVDRLIASVRAAGLERDSNVVAELGTTWRTVMGNPTEAAHLLGKLLVHLGPDNVVWGTDSIWYGSPQDQIEAFRAFQISTELQERYGYPALTPDLKARILGRTSAALYGIDHATVAGACEFSRDDLPGFRMASGAKNRTFGPRSPAEAARHITAAEPWEAAEQPGGAASRVFAAWRGQS